MYQGIDQLYVLSQQEPITIAIKLSIFLYDPDFQSDEKYFEFRVLFDMYTCILATKLG